MGAAFSANTASQWDKAGIFREIPCFLRQKTASLKPNGGHGVTALSLFYDFSGESPSVAACRQ
ncbi:MAG: hypothetical protein FWD31_02755 [Planctomycetaceae bacterium]|nr:hypothetical protein [Planctomycetaceae bacterium]